MKFSILTLFPEMVSQGLNNSIIGRAVEKGLLEIETVNIRDYTTDKHGKVDDYTYGGGAGMLIQAQPVYDAWEAISKGRNLRTIYVTPQGKVFNQKLAKELAQEEELIVLCGHYEGIDERVLEETVTDYVSIGDYVLTGGELAAMVIVDAVARLVPGVLGNEVSADTESFHRDLLEYPQYSRPEIWHGKKVPEVLLSGNHSKIVEWRQEKAKERTRERRPDLYEKFQRCEEVINKLLKRKRDNIHIIELLSRGVADILYYDGDNLLIYSQKCKLAVMQANKIETAEKLLQYVPRDIESFEISQEFLIPVLEEKLGMHVDMKCLNVVYTCKEPLPVKHKDIQVLSEKNLEYVSERYRYGSKDYILQQLKEGCIYGIYEDKALVGFIGEHEEGSIGILYVEPAYRGRCYAQSLEAYMINLHRKRGFTPFGQVEPDNKASLCLQKKCGLYVSQGYVWWMSSGEKWQNE